MTDPIQWHPTYEELRTLITQPLALHAAEQLWDATTLFDLTTAVLDAIWPQMQGKILEYEHALNHVTDPHDGPFCGDCQKLCQSALDGVNRKDFQEAAQDA